MTATTFPAARSGWGRRAPALAGLVLALLLALAPPAGAHGTGGEDASNFRSDVEGIVRPGGDAPVQVEGLRWQVLASDALLQVRNDTGRELLVEGYEGEPYLRVGPDGVLRNRNSPATYLNQERYGLVDLPPTATPDAAPAWERVSSEPSWFWHDHRIHWMAATDPPQVKVDPASEIEVLRWDVPFSLEGEDLALAGTLRYLPPPPWWPWVTGAGAVLAAGIALAASGRLDGDRRRALVRASAAGIGATAALTASRALDDVVTVPAALSEHALSLGTAALVVLPALLGALWAWRGGPAAPLMLVAGGLVLFAGTVSDAWSVLTSSQVATSLPPAVTRLVAALDVAALIPVAAAGWAPWTRQRAHAERTPSRVQPVASVLALLVLAGCAGNEPAVAGPTDRCQPVETVPIQGGAHLIGGREPPVPYNSTPPTSGWHSSGAFAIDVRGSADALTEPEQVSVLEAGGAVVSYHGLSDADRATLEETVGRNYDGRVAVTPYAALEEGTVAFSAWGAMQHCEGLDLEALEGFVTSYADERPDVPGEH